MAITKRTVKGTALTHAELDENFTTLEAADAVLAAADATHAALTAAHGVSGEIVGTTDTQTLSNKTLSSPAIDGTVTTAGLTLPAHSSGAINGTTIPSSKTLADTDSAQSFTNKTIVAANNTVTTAASGNLSAVELNAALAELQGDIDTRATTAALAASSGSSLVGFLQSGTGAVARTAQDKMRDVVSVKDFGSVGDGVTDDTAAIQAAINYAAGTFGGETGKTIFFPTGVYKITTKLTIQASGICWRTDGIVRFTGNDITGDYMLSVGGNPVSPIKNVDIAGRFIFFRNVANVGGGCIEWSYANYGRLQGVQFYNGRAPLLMHDCTGVTVEDIGWFETISGGIATGQYLARFHTMAQTAIRKLMNYASFATKANTKVIIDYDCDDIKITETTVGQISLTRTGGGGTFAPRWITIDKCYGESNYEIASFNFENCLSVKASRLTGNAGLVGAYFGASAKGVTLVNSTFLENQWDGVLIAGGSYLQIRDNDISSNNKAAGGSYSGIRVSGNCSYIDVTGNRIKNHLASSYTHAYGVLVASALTVSNLTVEDNDIADYVTGAFTDLAGATNKNLGTWTPIIAGQSVAGTQTYSVQKGWYQKRGKVVEAWGFVTLSAKDAATSGSIVITGLPYTASNQSNHNNAVGFSLWGNITLAANYTHLSGYILPNTTQIQLLRNGSGQAAAFVGASELGGTSQFCFYARYEID